LDKINKLGKVTAMIQTVNGKIGKRAFGKSLIHEHISCASNDFSKAFGKKWLDREMLCDLASDVLVLAKEKYNLGLLVDGTPVDIGRDALLLKNTSQKSGVHIVASSGFYWYPSMETDNNQDFEIAEFLISDCIDGMEDTDIKPGILKVASGISGITDEIVKRFSAIGITQKETGLPVYAHCEHMNDTAFRQIDMLKNKGANPEKIIIGHCALRPMTEYLVEILKRGCYVSLDQCFCFPDRLSDIARCITELCKKGYGKKILVANDYCIHSDFASRKQNGLHNSKEAHVNNIGYAFDKVFAEFSRLGGRLYDWEQITERNNLDVFCLHQYLKHNASIVHQQR
jgi:phosphotriesterase-related protein